MRKSVALTGCLILALAVGLGPLRAQTGAASPAPPAAPAPAAAPTGGGVEFEDEALPAAAREALARSAMQVSRWAMVQRIVQAVKKQQASQLPMERVQAIDQAWQRGEDPGGIVTSLARNDCSQALQTLVSANIGYSEAFVTDDRGVLVCMSTRTSDFWQGDEAKWSRAFADGRGRVFVSSVAPDASSGQDLVHISVPIRSGGSVIGVLIVGKVTG